MEAGEGGVRSVNNPARSKPTIGKLTNALLGALELQPKRLRQVACPCAHMTFTATFPRPDTRIFQRYVRLSVLFAPQGWLQHANPAFRGA